MTLSTVIMAHRKRADYIPELLAALDREVDVVWDRKNDRWDTGARAMLSYDAEADYHLVLQDDAIVSQDLIAGVERALDLRPELGAGKPMNLYIGKNSAFRHAFRTPREELSWITMGELNWGVGIIMPTGLIEDCVKWGWGRRDIPNYDKRISRWLGTQGIETWYTWPSLVDHRQAPSLVPGRGYRGRAAQRFIGAEASALDANWSGETARITPYGTSRVQMNRRRVRGRQRGRRLGSG